MASPASVDSTPPLVVLWFSKVDGLGWRGLLEQQLRPLEGDGLIRVTSEVIDAERSPKVYEIRPTDIFVLICTDHFSELADSSGHLRLLLTSTERKGPIVIPLIIGNVGKRRPPQIVGRFDLLRIGGDESAPNVDDIEAFVDAIRSRTGKHAAEVDEAARVELPSAKPPPRRPLPVSPDGRVREVQLLLHSRHLGLQTDGVLGEETRAALKEHGIVVETSASVTAGTIQDLVSLVGNERDETLLDVRSFQYPLAAARFDASNRVWAMGARGTLVRYQGEPPESAVERSFETPPVRGLEMNPAPGPVRAVVFTVERALALSEEALATAMEPGNAGRFDRNGRLATASEATLSIHDADGSTRTFTFDEAMVDVAWCKGNMIVGTRDSVSRWTPEGAFGARSAPLGEGSSFDAHDVVVSPDEQLIFVVRGGLRLLSFPSMALLDELPGLDDPITAVACSPDSKLVVVGRESGTVEVRETHGLEVIRSWRAHRSRVVSADFRLDGKRIVTASTDGTLKLWSCSQSPASKVAVLTSDLDHAKEAIGIARDVTAFSRVLLAKDLKPPISVGLFGDWGSGKSFFIEHLRRQIDSDAGASRAAEAAGETTGLVGEVRQITFNAWHYVDANLWAGLVSHLFDELGRKLRKEEDAATTRQRLVSNLATSQAAKKEAQARKDAAVARAQKAGERVANLAHDEALLSAATVQLQGSDILRASVAELAASAHGAKTTEQRERLVADWAMRLRKMSSTWGRLKEAAVLVATIRWMVALLVVAGVMIAVLLFVVPLSELQRMLGTVSSGVVALVVWLERVSKIAAKPTDAAIEWAQKIAEPLTSATKGVEKARDERAKRALDQAAHAAEASRAELKVSQAKLEQANAELVVATDAARQAEQDLEEANEGRQLFRFLSDRAGTEEYKRHLGVVSAIRKDLEQLSRLVGVPLRETDGGAKPTELVERIDRIVLYIDDLDRCPPERVVEVLEAVHLLLGMRLFVVVVAVDSRWLMRSLREHYRKLLPKNKRRGDVRLTTPHQFLEKIFQVPFVVPPFDQAAFTTLVRLLVSVEDKSIREITGSASVTTKATGTLTATLEPVTVSATATLTKPTTPEKPTSSPAAPKKPKPKPAPRVTRVTEDERTFMERLSPILATPRSLKSFTNIYRILRARMEDPAPDEPSLGAYIAERHYRVVLLLLATQVGDPAIARSIAADFAPGGAAHAFKTLDEYLKVATDRCADRNIEGNWFAWCAVVAALPKEYQWGSSLDAVRFWLPKVRRFSFEPWLGADGGVADE